MFFFFFSKKAPKKAKKRTAEGANSNVFSMFEQAQIQEFKEVRAPRLNFGVIDLKIGRSGQQVVKAHACYTFFDPAPVPEPSVVPLFRLLRQYVHLSSSLPPLWLR